jgi:hypothetical protein
VVLSGRESEAGERGNDLVVIVRPERRISSLRPRIL